MPTYRLEALRQVRAHDVVSVHLPAVRGGGARPLRHALCGGPASSPTTATCAFPAARQPRRGARRRCDERGRGATRRTGSSRTRRTTPTTRRLLRRHADRVVIVPPPVVMPRPAAADVESFRQRHGLNGAGPLDRHRDEVRRREGHRRPARRGPELLNAAHPQADGRVRRARTRSSARRRTGVASRPRSTRWETGGARSARSTRCRDAGVLRRDRLSRRPERELHRVVRPRAGRGDALRHTGRRERPARASGSPSG